ncbi:MAG TPA: sigma-70 family RNA polymerase sigma factor [Gaiellaceae bacterium]|nr:sigma-70 family RNA polymerase sigma factor [Gaiellaceae bacterium]
MPATRRPIPRSLRADGPLEYARLSDPILVRRAKDGDALALAALCERHAPRVERLARHLLRDPEDARDAAQDALARVCVKLRQFRGECAFGTWLHRLTVNACRDVAQRQLARRHEPLDEDRREARDADPAQQAERSALRRELGACLADLTPAQAKVVVLKDAFDLSFEEIAGAEGLPVGTAKSHAHRGRARLRSRLTDRVPA